jgi:SAM-dependent methyltransferase
MTTPNPDAAEQTEQVRQRYAAAARDVAAGKGTGLTAGPDDGDRFGAAHYQSDDSDLPDGVVAASLGCGNPVEVADLRAGQTVLDLGSGGGLDVLLSARRVGPTGKAIGLDMTAEMVTLARDHAARAGATNVEFLAGQIEQIRLPDGSVDVVISNCVITLSADKAAVFAEIASVVGLGYVEKESPPEYVPGDEVHELPRLAAPRRVVDDSGCRALFLHRGSATDLCGTDRCLT